MELKIVGQAFVFTSALATETIKKAERLVPDALVLTQEKNGEVEQLASIGIAKEAAISKYGVTFSATSKDGKAQGTIKFPASVKTDDRKSYIEENFGLTLVHASAIEAQVEAALAERQATVDGLFGNMEVE